MSQYWYGRQRVYFYKPCSQLVILLNNKILAKLTVKLLTLLHVSLKILICLNTVSHYKNLQFEKYSKETVTKQFLISLNSWFPSCKMQLVYIVIVLFDNCLFLTEYCTVLGFLWNTVCQTGNLCSSFEVLKKDKIFQVLNLKNS